MKIIRVRRGFSTNCSGANEFFPPEQQILAPPSSDAGPDGSAFSRWVTPPNTKVVNRWVTMMPDGAPPPMLREALRKSRARAAAESATTSEPTDAGAAQPAQTRTATSNSVVILLVVLGVLALFGVERLTRVLWRRLRGGSDGDRA